MLTYLIDTNVVSESIKPQPNPGVIDWMATVEPGQCCLSILTVAELRRGIALLEARNATTKARQITAWLERVEEEYAGRILGITAPVARAWAYLPGRPTDIDSLIAATAFAHDLTVVARNVADFDRTGVKTLNPFA